MNDWQVTATIIYCDGVDEDVTVTVYKDWTTGCTGYKKYTGNPDGEAAAALREKAKRTGRDLKCEDPQDYRVTDYKDKLIREDKEINLTSSSCSIRV